MYLKLKPILFEQTYFYWFLKEERSLINKFNRTTGKTLTDEQWHQSVMEVEHVSLLIKKYISETYNFDEITVKNEQIQIEKIITDIFKQLKMYIIISRTDCIDDFTSKNIIKNDSILYKIKNVILPKKYFSSKKEFNTDKSLSFISSNLHFSKYGLCRDYSLYFLTIFQLLGFELDKFTIVILPGHMINRYIGKNFQLNIESMNEQWKLYNLFMPNSYYLEEYKLMDGVSEKTGFLQNGSDKLIRAQFYYNFAILLFHHFKDYDMAKLNYESAINLIHTDAFFYFNYANLLATHFKSEKTIPYIIKQYKNFLKYAICYDDETKSYVIFANTFLRRYDSESNVETD